MTDFKKCSCKTSWKSREAFVLDPDIEPIGISLPPSLDSLRAYYFFNHTACKTTLMISSEAFADLIEEPIPSNINAGEEKCPDHCAKKEDLEICSSDCRNAPFRRFFVDRILKRKI
jgi:hypothetical protein